MSIKLVDNEGRVLESLIGESALKQAEELQERSKNKEGREFRKGVSSNNLRKFYDQFLKIYDSRVDSGSKRVMLLMMKAHIHYSSGRLNYRKFNQFISERIDAVLSSQTDKDFANLLKAFKLNFEAVVGYFPKSKN